MKRLIPIGMAAMVLVLTGTVAFAVAGGVAPPDASSIPPVVTGRSTLEATVTAGATAATEAASPAAVAATPTVTATVPAHRVTSALKAAVARRAVRAGTVTAPVTVPKVIVVAPRPEADPIADTDDGDDDHEVVTPGVRDDDDDHDDVDSEDTRRIESQDGFEDSSKPSNNEGD